MVENRFQTGTRRKPVSLVYGYDQELSFWAAKQLGTSGFGESRAIGVYDGEKIIASVVYFNYRHPNIEMAIASISPEWANKRTLKAFFSYPFIECNCNRVTVLVDSDNEQVRRFDERLGFVHEGTLRQGHPTGDAEIYGMLKTECRWIDGQEIESQSTAAA